MLSICTDTFFIKLHYVIVAYNTTYDYVKQLWFHEHLCRTNR